MEQNKQRQEGRWKLLIVIAICAAPLIASYLTYYVIKPEGRTNYGTLINPRAYPMPILSLTTLEGKETGLMAFKGKWIMLSINRAECSETCRKQLYDMRQLRLAQGKDKERVERVWVITDNSPVETLLMREYDGTRMLYGKEESFKAWLPTDEGTNVSDHIYLIDPLGNLMMRFPKNADPNKIKKDLVKLLKASRIG